MDFLKKCFLFFFQGLNMYFFIEFFQGKKLGFFKKEKNQNLRRNVGF